MNELRTFKNIQDGIIARANLDATSTVVRNQVKEYINTSYQFIAYRKPYRWTGETRHLKLLAKATAGTIAVTSGQNTVTGTSTAFTEATHLHCKIKIGSNPNPFRITRVASTTSLVIDAPYTGSTASGLSYVIYKDEYGLFPDLVNIRRLYVPNTSVNYQPYAVGPDEMDQRRMKMPFSSGSPRYYTINGFGYYRSVTWANFKWDVDYWEDPFTVASRNQKLVVWPALNTSDLNIQIRFTKEVKAMSADADEPLMPLPVRKVLVYGPLYENFAAKRDIQMLSVWKREYQDVLKQMEADVESTDDELTLTVDRRYHMFQSQTHTDELDYYNE